MMTIFLMTTAGRNVLVQTCNGIPMPPKFSVKVERMGVRRMCRQAWTYAVVLIVFNLLESDGRSTKLLAEGQRGVEAFQRGDFETAVSIFRRFILPACIQTVFAVWF